MRSDRNRSHYDQEFWPEGAELQSQFVDALREIIGLDPMPRRHKEKRNGNKLQRKK